MSTILHLIVYSLGLVGVLFGATTTYLNVSSLFNNGSQIFIAFQILGLPLITALSLGMYNVTMDFVSLKAKALSKELYLQGKSLIEHTRESIIAVADEVHRMLEPLIIQQELAYAFSNSSFEPDFIFVTIKHVKRHIKLSQS